MTKIVEPIACPLVPCPRHDFGRPPLDCARHASQGRFCAAAGPVVAGDRTWHGFFASRLSTLGQIRNSGRARYGDRGVSHKHKRRSRGSAPAPAMLADAVGESRNRSAMPTVLCARLFDQYGRVRAALVDELGYRARVLCQGVWLAAPPSETAFFKRRIRSRAAAPEWRPARLLPREVDHCIGHTIFVGRANDCRRELTGLSAEPKCEVGSLRGKPDAPAPISFLACRDDGLSRPIHALLRRPNAWCVPGGLLAFTTETQWTGGLPSLARVCADAHGADSGARRLRRLH